MSTIVYFDIKRFAVHDGPGIRTTLFMKGCPLRCWWCHNPESQAVDPFTVEYERKVDGKMIPAHKTYGERAGIGELMKVLLRDLPYFEESGGGITFSGGEPLMQLEGLLELLQRCKEKKVHTTIDTSGFAPQQAFRQILPFTDLFLYDLKNIDPALHQQYTGVDNALIRSNADFLLEQGASLVFRIPVVPGINDTKSEVEGMISYISERKEHLTTLHLLPYHRIADHKYLRMRMKQHLPHVKEPGEEYMEQIRSRFEATGLEVVIGG